MPGVSGLSLKTKLNFKYQLTFELIPNLKKKPDNFGFYMIEVWLRPVAESCVVKNPLYLIAIGLYSTYSYLSNKRTCPLILFKKKVQPTL